MATPAPASQSPFGRGFGIAFGVMAGLLVFSGVVAVVLFVCCGGGAVFLR
jgi:hypothetical protein